MPMTNRACTTAVWFGSGALSLAVDKRCPLATPGRLEGTRRASTPFVLPLPFLPACR